jgi:hypothetical protein
MTKSDKHLNLLRLRGMYRWCSHHKERGGYQRGAEKALRTGSAAGSNCTHVRRRSLFAVHLAIPSQRNPRVRLRVAAGMLLCTLTIIASFAGWGSRNIGLASADSRASQPVSLLATSGTGYMDIGRLAYAIFHRQMEAQNLVLPVVDEDIVTGEVNSLLKRFGAEESRAPGEFVGAVRHFIQQYQERDRGLILRALVDEGRSMEKVREILRQDRIPEDLAYMALVESGLAQSSTSDEGAAGFWQFTEIPAREYGIRVDDEVDERFDLTKSTQAASRYLRDLILDFGSGSSVMLAMAAYNSGREAVRRAVRTVKDPIKQRNFWYLYCTQALPAETREYVPKVFAAIIVGHDPQRFGFQKPAAGASLAIAPTR